MKWPKGKKRNGSSKKNKGANSTSPSKSADSPSLATTPGLGTLRLGTLRPESAPICTPTPTSRRQLISDLLTDDEEDSSTVTASPALRSIISNKSSTGCVDSKKGRGDSFTSYTSEEKVRGTTQQQQSQAADVVSILTGRVQIIRCLQQYPHQDHDTRSNP